MFLGIFRGATFLGNFRGPRSSEISEGHVPRKSSLGIFRGTFRRSSGPQSFFGIPSEISEGFPRKNEFPKSYFRGLLSSVYRRNSVIPATYRRFFPSVCRCFLVVSNLYIIINGYVFCKRKSK